MFESKLAVVLRPQMLDKFEESKTTVEMVEKAIEKGYVLSRKTSDFLFKYEAIVDLLIRTQNNLELFEMHLPTLMSCETRRKELTIYYAENFTKLDHRLNAEYFVDYIDEEPKYADFIQRILGVSYLRKNPEYVYSKEFDLENYYATDEFLDFLDEINVDFNKLHRGVEWGLEDYISRFPRILKAKPFEHDLHSYKAYKVIKEMIEEGKLTYDDIPEFLMDEDLLELLVINEPQLLDKHPEFIDKFNNNSYYGNKCVKKFLSDLPDSLVNMEAISYAFDIYDDGTRKKIVDAIKESGFLITKVKWDFILNNNELIMDQIRKNPNILNTCPNLLTYSVNEENYKEIMEVVEKNGIVLHTLQNFYYNNEEFMKFLLKNNPFIFYNLSKDEAGILGYRGEELGKMFDGPIIPSAPAYGKKFDEGFVEAVRMNPYNYYALLSVYNKKPYSLEAYEAYLQSGMDLYGSFYRPTVPDMRFDNIEELRSYGASKICLDSYGDEYMDYPLYYVANHPDLVEVRNPNNTYFLRVPSQKSESGFSIEVDSLNADFSNYIRLKKDLTQEELLRINDMYWANKANIVASEEQLISNHYIFINELLLNNNMMGGSIPEFTSEEIEYYNKRFKELNCKINGRNYYYVRDFDLLFEALQNGNHLRYIDIEWMNEEQLNKWFDVIRDQIINNNFKINEIPVEFIIKNYDFIKEYYDYASLFSRLHYYVNDGEHNEIFMDLIEHNNFGLYPDDLKVFDEDTIRHLFNKNYRLLSLAKRSYDELDFWIQEIIDEFEYDNIKIDVKGEISKDTLEKIFQQNPTNINLFMNYKQRKNISDELYIEYYKKCLENIKNGYSVSSVSFDSEIDFPIDVELLNYLLSYDRELSIEYLKSYYNREHDFVINYILDNIDKYKVCNVELAKILSNEDIELIISKNSNFLDEQLFRSIFTKFNSNPNNFTKLYEWWKSLGKPVDNTLYFNNGFIAQDILSNWEGNLFEFERFAHDVDSPVGINMIYNYYKSQGDKVDITSSRLFYENPLILLDYAGKEIPMPPPLDLSWQEELEIQLLIAKDKPYFARNISRDYFIEKLIKDDPVKMMELMPYKNKYVLKILSALKEIGYKFDVNTPLLYLKDHEVLLQILEDDNDAIDFVINALEVNDINLDYSNNRSLKDYVSKIVVERSLAKYAKYVNYYDLKDFLIEILDKDFNAINELKDVRIDMNILKYIFSIALDKIKSGEYVIDENTPYFLFYSDEIRAIARDIDPKLVENCPLERLDRARDHSLIYKAIDNPLKVDELFIDVNRNFPEELVNQLVDKLIANDYKISDKTPMFLLCNCKFVYHLLKNNVSVDDKYIHNFVTFENYYKLKDKQLFTELINKGYGNEFRNFIIKFGLDDTLELASQYGYLLNLVDISSIRNFEDIPVLLVSGRPALDVFERVPDLDAFLTRCDNKKVSSYQYSTALMNKYLMDIEANKDKIILLIKHEFSFNFDDSLGKKFNSNPELINMFVTYSPLKYSVCNIINSCDPEILTNEIIMNAINNGYVINEYTPVHIRTNPVYVYEIINRAQSVSDVTSMINRHKDIALNQAIINKLIDLHYEITTSTPDVILGNLEFLVPYFERCNYSNDFRTGMKLVSSEKYKELLYAMDAKKMVLYFKDIVPEESYEAFALDFVSIADSKRDILIKMLTDGKRLNDSIKTSYEKYIIEHISDIKYEDMDKVIDCLIRISQSNSGEIRQFANTLVEEVLKFDNYEAAFNKVEDIFLQDHLPMVTKLFLVFKVLHKDYSRFNGTYLSPVLKAATDAEKDNIIYKDLLRSAFRSNNRSLLEYLHDLSDACDTLEQYENDKENVNIDKLNKALMFLLAIVNSSYVKNHDSSEVKLTNDYDSLITMLKEQFKGYGNLKDAIVQNLFDFPTYEDAVRYIHDYAKEADKRNRERIAEGFVVKPGDYIKGIGSVNFLTNILQNGSVSKEFLGDSAGSDATPLDTDLSRINIETSSVGQAINSTAASGYGSDIYFVLRDGSRFAVTRTKDGGEALDNADPDKLESFHTSVCDNNFSDHYGIRTGFASSEIDFIVSTDKKTQLEVVLNGFYIPIVDREGNLIFTPEDYDKLRSKMSGIEYYNSGPYQIASYEDLIAPGVEELAQGVSDNRVSIKLKHNAIKAAVRKGMSEVNVIMKDKLDGNVKAGYADLIDTGSTARGTDLPGKADFDYICRVDRSLFNNPVKFQAFKDSIKNQFVSIDKEEYVNGNFRFKGVVIEGLEDKVDIDLSFVIRTTKLTISSDESLLTRMDAIENGSYTVEGDRTIDNPVDARNLVTGNILMAKKLLKAYKCYKKHSSPEKEGGLGGIGIENWILQHGGSLKRAAEDFMSVAEKCETYEEFKKQYSIWDFGQNHYALEGSDYSHDDFVYKNMDAAGYERMKAALKCYLEYGMKALDEEVATEIVNRVNEQLSKGSGKSL